MQSSQWKQASLTFITVCLLLMLAIPVQAAPGDTTLISRSISPSRVQSKGSSIQTAISADGRYIAFTSDASNLVSYDGNGVADIFVYDRLIDEMERVSVHSSGEEANQFSERPSISPDGRYVAFESGASNLVSGDTNGMRDIFVHDRQTGLTERVSVHSTGVQANDNSFYPSLSVDGRFIIFQSYAANLVSGDTNFVEDVFLHDRETGITERISVNSSGGEANSYSISTSISVNGRYVAFDSAASNLVDNDTNGHTDIFVRDRQTGVIERVSVSSSGEESNHGSRRPSISADGRYIAFESEATNIVSGDTNNSLDIFVHDRQTRQTERVSVNSSGFEADGTSVYASISGDGLFVAFMSFASNLSGGDTNGTWDVFVHERQTSVTERASISSSGVGADYDCSVPSISGDGRYVAFESRANNLVSDDTNEMSDIYLRDRQDAKTERMSLGMLTVTAGASTTSSISANGRYVAFTSNLNNLVSDDTNNRTDIFVYDHQAGVMERLNSGGVQANDGVYEPSLSGDGRYVAFRSQASNLVSGDTNGTWDVFVYDRQTDQIERVSVASDGAQGNRYSVYNTISADGRYVAFQSAATNLIANDTNNYPDIFVHDRLTGNTERVSVNSDGAQVMGDSYEPSLSADGRFVAFYSYATTLVSGDTNLKIDVFVHDRETDTTERVSLASDGTQANDVSYDPVISDNGRYVAFRSQATNLVSDDTNNSWDVFVYDRDTDTIKRVSVLSDGSQGYGSSGNPSLSSDGRYVAFSSYAVLVPGDANGSSDIFIYDRDTETIERVSLAKNDGGDANDDSHNPALSGDGRYVAFGSLASNLMEGDGNELYDLFLRENDVEVPSGLYVVTKTADTNDGVCNGDCSLREAMDAAASGATIRFDPLLAGQTITLSSALPAIDKVLTIEGHPQAMVIDGAGSYRIFELTETGDLTIDHLVIHNGNSSASCFDHAAITCGGGMYSDGTLTIKNSTFYGNSAELGGAIFVGIGTTTISNSTFHDNSATDAGGGIFNWMGSLHVINSTFYGNSATYGGAIYNDLNSLTLANSTFSGNAATSGAGLYNAGISLDFMNNILADSVSGDDCYNEAGVGKISANVNNLIEHNAASPNHCGIPALTNDPKLGALQGNGGPTRTMALGLDSPAIDTGDDLSCTDVDQRGVARPQGNHCDIGAYEATDFIEVSIGADLNVSYPVDSGQSRRVSFPAVNGGPVKIMKTDDVAIMASERVIYRINGAGVSFSEMMGLPAFHMDQVYWLPWYNNKDLNTQLRIANISNATATIHISIGGTPVLGSPFTLASGASMRKSFASIDKGPVKIESNQDIIAAERVIYKVNGVDTSFSEMMAMPAGQVDKVYWLPWYNNKDLNTQLRIANVSGSTANVSISIGGTPVPGSPFSIPAGASIRKSFRGIDKGPVKIESDQDVVAAERVIYRVNDVDTSFSEMMALPARQVDQMYWLPWYNNRGLNSQLRIANVSDATATVHASIGGTPVSGSPFSIPAGASIRKSFPNLDKGPVRIESDQDIVAAERVIYKVNGVDTSFSEMMALPTNSLDLTFWLPWYNNVELDTQLRFGVP